MAVAFGSILGKRQDGGCFILSGVGAECRRLMLCAVPDGGECVGHLQSCSSDGDCCGEFCCGPGLVSFFV